MSGIGVWADRFRAMAAHRAVRWLLMPMLVLAGITAVVSADAPPPAVNLAAEPLYARGARAKPTLTLALSVEFPTVGAQYLSGVSNATDDATYLPTNKYIGYFDAESCYVYNDSPTEMPTGAAASDYKRFDRSKAATNRTCGGDSFSGNFLNWSTSSAVDILRYGLSGGDRWIDTSSLTVLQRAYLPTTADNNSGNFWNGTNFPSKQLSAALAPGAVPTALLGGYAGVVYVANCRDRLHFGTAKTGSCDAPGSNSNLGVPGASQVGTVQTYSGSASTAIARFGGTQCAVENLASNTFTGYTATTTTCAFGGIKTVLYGVESGLAPNGNGNTGWLIASVANGVACASGPFGSDPATGSYKKCYVRDRVDGDPPLGGITASTSATTALSSDAFFYARVSVCTSDASGNLTDLRSDLCTRYPNGNYKPTGNLQKYSDRIRVAAFGYLLDNADSGFPRTAATATYTTTSQRQGGVLRAPMKYVGPKTFDANFSLVSGTNPNAEWNESTGVFIANPDGASPELYSGVTNYLNRFGRTGTTLGHYKRRDPVGELYYEALRYLQGLQPTPQAIADIDTALKDGYPAYTTWTDPHPAVAGTSDYSCVKNNILTIGDMNTNADLYVPGNPSGRANSNDPARSTSDSANEPDFWAWTKVVGAFESGHTEVTYVDGKGVTRSVSNPNTANTSLWGLENKGWGSGAGYYMAGVAYWANTHDIRGSNWTVTANRRPGMRVTTYTLDVNEFGQQTAANVHQSNPFFLAAKYGGFADVTGTGNPFKGTKTGATGELLDANGNIDTNINWENPPGSGEAKNYYLASSAQSVLDSLNSIFEKVAKEANSIAGGAISTQRLTSAGGLIYQAQFDPADWSGDLVAYGLTVNGTTTTIADNGTSTAPPTWKASTQLDAKSPASRKIFLGKTTPTSEGTATLFQWDNVETSTQNALRAPAVAASGADSVAVGQARLNFLRGDRTLEAGAPATAAASSPVAVFRKRGAVLGDIVNSGVAYADKPILRIAGDTYATYYNNSKNRKKALYVGANDGMLHAFDADTGDELFAYIPSWLVPRLSALTSTSYSHQSYLDGTPVVAEAQVGSAWKTVLVSGTGGGGQGVFALDVSNPESFDAGRVMWEFTDRDDTDMGNVIGRPHILKFRTDPTDATKDRYFAVVASGVNNYVDDGHFNANADPTIFLLDLAKAPSDNWVQGTNYFKIALPSTLSSSDVRKARGVAGFSERLGDAGEVMALYAGDLEGNLWKLDFNKVALTDWSISTLSYFKDGSKPLPLYIAKDASGNRQPITMEPKLLFGPNGGLVVAFGTGKFLETSDIAPPYSTQSVYAVLDNMSKVADSSSPQSAIAGRGRLKQGTASANGVAVDVFAWGRSQADNDSSVSSGWYFDFFTTGERQVSGIASVAGRLVFGSVIPATTSCDSGSGNLYVIGALTGDGTATASTVGILGEPFALPVGDVAVSARNATGLASRSQRYQIILQGSSGLQLPPVTSAYDLTPALRLAWREVSNYQDLRRAP